MMNNVMLSLKPYWGRKILSGEKTADIRKSMPHGEGPFRVLLYETRFEKGCGAVVGECVCFCAGEIRDYSDVTECSLLSVPELAKYAGNRKIYAWFLAEVVRYSAPRPLSEFGLKRAPQSWCYVRNSKLS